MDRIMSVLIDRLAGKGIEIRTIPAFLRDLFNSLAGNGYLSLQGLNKRIQLLGWDDFELDDHTFQLILAIFESDRWTIKGGL